MSHRRVLSLLAAGGLLFALLLFAVQVGISHVWLRHFRFGPM